MNKSGLRQLGVALACGGGGPLLLGRVVTLPIAIMFGPAFGVVSASIAALGALRTSIPLGVAWTILAGEAIIVGWFARRGKSPLIAGAIVWGAVAAAIVFVPNAFRVGIDSATVWPLALQVVVNSLVAIVVAELIAVALAPWVDVRTA